MKGCLAMITWMAVFILCFWAVPRVVAQEDQFPPAGDESANYHTDVILAGLDYPTGLALKPDSVEKGAEELFFAESGAGRVLRFAVASPGTTKEVLKGLKTHAFGENESIQVGPWALGFLTPSKLVVVGGVLENGKEQVGVYLLPENSQVLAADQTDHSVGPLAERDTADQLGFLGVSIGDTAAYFSCGAENAPGQIFYSPLEANRLDSFRPILKQQPPRWPAGICLSPVNPADSQYLVSSTVGELQEARDSELFFLAPSSGTELLQLKPGLFDMVGLAYSESGLLYAIDCAWHQPKAGGVYRLDDARWEGQPACRAVKIASVERPTSMAFGSDGAMYVTVFGSPEKPKQGKIIKITGEF